MVNSIIISTIGIKKILKKYDIPKAITEYIWNGFDAGATTVDAIIKLTEINTLRELSIIDNGSGIQHDLLKEKFTPFFESDKELGGEEDKRHTLPHGKIGVGRLTFFKFANFAKWTTTYEEKNGHKQYVIDIKKESLDKFSGGDSEPVNVDSPIGTKVEFTGFEKEMYSKAMIEEIIEYIHVEFCWFLELFKHKKFCIKINGKPIDYSKIIEDTEDFLWKIDNYEFKVRYIQWKNQLNYEYSKYYFLKENYDELYKEYTKLNKQGDEFHHSVYISSSYFEKVDFEADDSSAVSLVGKTKGDKTFKELNRKLYDYLRKKRKPFLRKKSKIMINEYEKEGIFPIGEKEGFEKIKIEELKTTIRELYEVQPKIFLKLNEEQKKTFIGFVNLLLESDERERLLEIIEKVTELEPYEREELRKILRTTKLSAIIKSVNMIKDRYKQVISLKQLIFASKEETKEQEIQDKVEEMTWLFGEQYALLGSCEDNFEKLLRKLRKHIFQEDVKVKMEYPEKNKQPDVFMCRQQKKINQVDNVLIELKNPRKKLGDKELEQIKKYMKIILKEDMFNGFNFTWEFFLIGNSINEKSIIEEELDNAKGHGEKGLIFKTNKYKIYVKTWSEIFNEFELRHEFIDKKLQLDKKKLALEVSQVKKVAEKPIFAKYETKK